MMAAQVSAADWRPVAQALSRVRTPPLSQALAQLLWSEIVSTKVICVFFGVFTSSTCHSHSHSSEASACVRDRL